MEIQKLDEQTELIVLRKGEQAIERLTRHCKDKGITNASFSGIGAVDHIVCGYYDLEQREYVFTDYPQLCEVVNLSANVMLKDEQPFVHMHATFTDSNNRAFGGHVKEMRVGVTLEIFLRRYATTYQREYDDGTGLHLINPAL
jgi:hypothetical protein